MTRITHAAALALSLVMTLAIFTSVAHLPSLSSDGAPLAPEAITALLPGVEVRVVRATGEERSLLQEVWRFFLVLLVLALLAEAALCVGESRREARA